MTARRLSQVQKETRVWDVLSTKVDGEFPRMHGMAELAARARLTVPQASDGWYGVRRQVGELAVMEHHGRNGSMFYLSDDASAGNRYLFWQVRHYLTRMVSAAFTELQLRGLDEYGLGDWATIHNGTIAMVRQQARQIGAAVGYSISELDAMLAKP